MPRKYVLGMVAADGHRVGIELELACDKIVFNNLDAADYDALRIMQRLCDSHDTQAPSMDAGALQLKATQAALDAIYKALEQPVVKLGPGGDYTRTWPKRED